MSKIRVAAVVAGAIAIAFGALTILSGGRALFGGEAARQAVGNAVPFVLWFNFAAGLAYVIAGVGLLLRLRWAFWLSTLIAAATVLVFAAFGVHIALEGTYEMRTVAAMTARTLVWMVLAVTAHIVTAAIGLPRRTEMTIG